MIQVLFLARLFLSWIISVTCFTAHFSVRLCCQKQGDGKATAREWEQANILLSCTLLFCTQGCALPSDMGHFQFCLNMAQWKALGRWQPGCVGSGVQAAPLNQKWAHGSLGWFMLSQRVFCGDRIYNRLGGGWVQCFVKRSPVSQFVLCLNTAKASENNSGSWGTAVSVSSWRVESCSRSNLYTHINSLNRWIRPSWYWAAPNGASNLKITCSWKQRCLCSCSLPYFSHTSQWATASCSGCITHK